MAMKGNPITEELFDYIVEHFAEEDDLLRRMPADAALQGVPMIHISPEQGKYLQVLMKSTSAKNVIEVGSLFGYSTIWMARALPADGKLITLELSPLHAEVTRRNVERAGLASKVEVRQGPANELLATLRESGEGPFDFAFIDADKPGYVAYLDHLLKLIRPGGVIVGDNASAAGNVWKWKNHAYSTDDYIKAIHAFNHRMATEPRLTSVLVPISDGMCVGVVNP